MQIVYNSLLLSSQKQHERSLKFRRHFVNMAMHYRPYENRWLTETFCFPVKVHLGKSGCISVGNLFILMIYASDFNYIWEEISWWSLLGSENHAVPLRRSYTAN